MTETTRLPASPCPSCGKMNDAATGQSGDVPDPGDVSICFYCAEVCLFDDQYRLVLCDDEAIREAPEVVRYRAFIILNGRAIWGPA